MLTSALALLAAGAVFAAVAGADNTHEYEIEMFNAFGIVDGSDVRVSGVNVGTVTDLSVNERKRAVVSVELSGELAVLGEDTTCSSEPQSLIAEYFIDCEPSGEPLEDGAMVPAEQVQQTVQADLVQNTVREPYMARFAILLNEFGTALAGNPESLNTAIRLGAPALTQFERALEILADQRNIIRRLNVDSNRIMREMAAQRNEVVSFIEEARDAGEISSSRRADLSRQFEIFDDFLAELQPTLGSLEQLALEQTPLLRDLQAAAPGLNRLALNLPPFNRASAPALETLGEALKVGERTLTNGRREIRLLGRAGRRAPRATRLLADLLSDLDDPRRAVEIDRRAGHDTGRKNTRPGQRDTMGYTGLEGLLNYTYYQTLAANQFDRVGHLLHFGLYGVNSGPCGQFSSGRDPSTGEPGVLSRDGGTTTNVLEAHRCIGWLGKNQPGLNERLDLPSYNSQVCRDGSHHPQTSPQNLDPKPICSPPGSASRSRSSSRDERLREMIKQERETAVENEGRGRGEGRGGNGGGGGKNRSGGPRVPDLPKLPGLNGLNSNREGRVGGGGGGDVKGATGNLFDFLFSDR